VKLRSTPAAVAACTRVSAEANSRMRWRQLPQGVTSSGPSPTTSMSAISRPPAATMAAIAPASAQVPLG